MRQTVQTPTAFAGQATVTLSAKGGEHITSPLGAEHLMLIVPSDEGERQAQAMENFFQACASDEAFSLELVGTRREQGFVLRASSSEQLILLSKQFAANYPQAELQRIAPSADPLVLHAGEHAVIGTIAMTQKPWMPLKTFSGKALAEPGGDPLAGILAAMEPLGSGQRCIAQLALVRAPDHWISRYIRKSVEHPLQGERDAATRERKPTTDTAEGLKTFLLVGGAFGLLLGYRWYLLHAWVPIVLLLISLLSVGIGLLWWKFKQGRQDIYDMKLIAEKLARQAFYTSLRVIVIGKQSTSTQEQLQAHLKRLEVVYRQLTLASANSLSLKRERYLRASHRQATWLTSAPHAFPYWHPFLSLLHGGAPGPDIWNGLELSGAFHLPQALTDLPLVQRLSVKHLLASPEIARQIEHAAAPLPPALIGYSKHRGYAIPVSLPYETLFSHKFLIARSRYGKSTLIQLLAQAAMQPVQDGSRQPGLFVIDPHNEVIMPIVTKLGVFQDNQQMRRIVGQPVTKAPVHLAITEGKIVLCALSSREMDDAAVNVLGSTLINLLHRAFHLQEATPLAERRKVFCAVDEFHAFSGGDYDRLLSEDGKFGSAMLLATQNLTRLNKIRDGLLEMIFSNCDNLCVFNVAAADAKILEQELRGMVESKHIISQPRLHCYARLSIPGHPMQIVSVELAKPPSWQRTPARLQHAEVIRRRTQRQNDHVSVVDQHYAQHLAQFLDVTPFAQRVQYDARAAQHSKRQREEAEQLAEDARQVQQQQRQQGTVAEKVRQEHDGTPASIGRSLAGGSSAQQGANGDGSEEGKRNHPRSKRKKGVDEVADGSPGSRIEGQDLSQQPEEGVSRPKIALRGLGGGSFWGNERERRE